MIIPLPAYLQRAGTRVLAPGSRAAVQRWNPRSMAGLQQLAGAKAMS